MNNKINNFYNIAILFIILLIFFIYEITNKEELIDSVPTLEERTPTRRTYR